jgi:NAD-dependent SIR2 family protein deacetylase
MPTAFHKFLQMLDACGQLKRIYSQNIDGLEAKVGFDIFATNQRRKCVLLHGNVATLRCEKCASLYMLENYLGSLDGGEDITCPGCIKKGNQDSALEKRLKKPGHLRSNILLYNEPSPLGEDVGDITSRDAKVLKSNHVLLICGTSLHIPGVRTILKTLNHAMFDASLQGCRIIYVDITPNPSSCLPEGYLHVKMDCQEFATNAIAKLNNATLQADQQADRQETSRRDFRPFWHWN